MKRISLKINLNCENLLNAASMLKVLGHPIRMTIVELLETSSRMSVMEIYKALNIEQAIASHHLNTLKNKRLLNSDRVGRNTFYSLAHTNIGEIVKLMLDVQK